MPGKARPGGSSCRHSFTANKAHVSPREAMVAGSERRWLQVIQNQALHYFLDNQLSHGLVLDRQRNHGPLSRQGLCSTSATGMGLMALALAAAPEYRLLSPRDACDRVRTCLKTALDALPCDHGMMPHFLDCRTLKAVGSDAISTIDSSWLAAGALWAGLFLESPDLLELARKLYRRIDWVYWSREGKPDEGAFLLHGRDRHGRFLPHAWDRLNAETAFMYVLAIGAAPDQALSPASWAALDSCYGSVAGLRFPSADLGLFVFQYSMELLDFHHYLVPGPFDFAVEMPLAARANHEASRSAANRFATYRYFWGLSAGDGPPGTDGEDVYRCYSPREDVDGTAHVTATLASLSTCPELVLENLHAVRAEPYLPIRGRYGYSNVNVDRHWVSRDVVGIDLGAAVLALDNFLHQGRVRRVFHQLECIRQGLNRLDTLVRSTASFQPFRRQAS